MLVEFRLFYNIMIIMFNSVETHIEYGETVIYIECK